MAPLGTARRISDAPSPNALPHSATRLRFERALGFAARVLAVALISARKAEPSIEPRRPGNDESRFRTLVEQAPVAVQIYTPDGFCVYANHAWELLWDTNKSNLKGYNILTDPQFQAQGTCEWIRRGFNGEAIKIPPVKFDPALSGRPGRVRWIAMQLFPIKSSDGRVVEVALFKDDVTAEVEAMEAAQKAVRTRDEFLSIASHELKTPLTPLRLQLDTVLRFIQEGDLDGPAIEKLRAMAKLASSQVVRLTQLIDDLLDVTRISSGKLSLNKRSLDLEKVIRETVDRHHAQLLASGCHVEIRCSEAVEGKWDRARLEQVVSNLLTNSMKYAGRGTVTIAIWKERNRVRFSVQDQGPGIEDSDLERIFEKFERAEANGSAAGLGLGLYICRKIIEAHGGWIIAESRLGLGTKFTVELPMEES